MDQMCRIVRCFSQRLNRKKSRICSNFISKLTHNDNVTKYSGITILLSLAFSDSVAGLTTIGQRIALLSMDQRVTTWNWLPASLSAHLT